MLLLTIIWQQIWIFVVKSVCLQRIPIVSVKTGVFWYRTAVFIWSVKANSIKKSVKKQLCLFTIPVSPQVGSVLHMFCSCYVTTVINVRIQRQSSEFDNVMVSVVSKTAPHILLSVSYKWSDVQQKGKCLLWSSNWGTVGSKCDLRVSEAAPVTSCLMIHIINSSWPKFISPMTACTFTSWCAASSYDLFIVLFMGFNAGYHFSINILVSETLKYESPGIT